MAFKNNYISQDTDAEHLVRARLMADGLVTHGASLDFTEAQIEEYATYAEDIFKALDKQHEESADVDEYFLELKNAFDAAKEKYRACQSVVKGEMELAEPGTAEYLDERFDIDDDFPRDQKGFIKVAEFMISAFDAIGVEHPDVTLPPAQFEALRTLVAEMNTALEAIDKELSEQKEATVSKNVLRNTVGEKILKKCYHRAIAYWGYDDPRMLEIGLVPKSAIWTPGEGEPEEPVEPGGAKYPDAPQNMKAEKAPDPMVGIWIHSDLLEGATSYTLYRATAAPGDPEPPRPETPWMSEMEQPSAADTDLIVGNKYIYWLCGVKDNVEGNFANAYMEWNE